MNLNHIGTCRGEAFAYLKFRLSNKSLKHDLCVTACFRDAFEIPVLWYPVDSTSSNHDRDCVDIVVAVPLFTNGPLELRFSDGQDSTNYRTSFTRITWASRFTYRMNKSLAQQMRDIETQDSYRRIGLFIDYIIPDGDYRIVRAWADVPSKSSDKLEIVFWDISGQRLEATPVFLSNTLQPSPVDSRALIRRLIFTFRIPAETGRFVLFARDNQNEDLVGYLSLTQHQINLAEIAGEKLWKNAEVDDCYHDRYLRSRITASDIACQREASFNHNITFSVIVLMKDESDESLTYTIDSIVQQSYPRWKLTAICFNPENVAAANVIRKTAQTDIHARYTVLNQNLNENRSQNLGIAADKGEYCCFVNAGDTLEPNALFEYALAIEANPDVDLLYCDEDSLSRDGARHFAPYYKPDFDIYLLRSQDYLSHLLCIQTKVLTSIDSLVKNYDEAYTYNLALLATEVARKVHHVRKVLYHCRARIDSTNEPAFYPEESARSTAAHIRAVTTHLDRAKLSAIVEKGSIPHSRHVRYLVEGFPLVSIIIPNKDCGQLLFQCITSILDKTTYDNYEIIIVENNSTDEATFVCYERLKELDSRVKVVSWPAEFNFSKIINFGVEQSTGDYLVFLNNDTEVISGSWIADMLGLCQLNDVGVVGARLLYPDDTIQHAGVVVTDLNRAELLAFHTFIGLPDTHAGYFGCGLLTHRHLAVTAACLMTSRLMFERVGRFDENLAVTFNDLEYCFKVHEQGLAVVYEPAVKLYHHESVSRGLDFLDERKHVRSVEEGTFVQHRWASIFVAGDPYLNPNLKSNYYRLDW